MHRPIQFHLLFALLSVAVVAGCGYKGDLYLAEEPRQPSQQEQNQDKQKQDQQQ